MKCPVCGAENDAANRFCDQCGSKLEPVAATSAPVAAVASAPSAATPSTCPNCGAAVLPGEAFCDECGAPLSAAPVVSGGAAASGDAPTMIAPPNAIAAPPTPSTDATVVCPACGHHNAAGDHFCENCGASLAAAQAATVTAPTDQVEMTAPPPVDPVDALADNAPQGADQLFGQQPSAPTADEAPTAAVAVETEHAPVPPDELELAPAVLPEPTPADDTPEVPLANAPAQPDSSAERQRLSDEIARQEQIIAQFEQMQTMFGANVPPAVAQGLSEARTAREQANNALSALPAEAPAIDPAEVARYQDEISRQDQIIAQFEQMQTMFGANVPPAVAQGLSEARTAREQAANELAALTGGTVPASSAAPVATPAATPAATSVPATAPFTAAPPAPRVPKLIVEASGAEIPLQLDKAELIIGREDPISGIFPEVDLTGFGGESGGVSRQHAKLVHSGDQWAVVDLNSTNYTRVDGNKLDPNVPAPVRDGSKIQLGRVVVVFHAA